MTSDNFKNPGAEYRPDVRWWLAEGLHTDQTLKHDLDLLLESGFGAIEFLAMDDLGAENALYGWGSEEWVHDSRLLFEETTKRGMGVSTTCGTNWSNCNLTSITPNDRAAAKELDYEVERIKAGETRSGKIRECELKMEGVTKQDLVAALAIKDCGKKEDGLHYLEKDGAIVLTDKIENGMLEFTAPKDGDYLLFFFWIHGTGQTAGPSASVSYTVNYLDHDGIDAFIEYWDREVITPELQETICENGRVMMYMDSLELSTFSKGGQLWGYTFLDEFRARRGYDLTPYLPFVVKNPGMLEMVDCYDYHTEDRRFAEKLLNDLYQTMTDMYMQNMMKPMKEWCNKRHMWLRSEISYGLPFEISQPGKYVDDVETESLEFASQIDSHRGLAGTAHVYGRMYSSETGAVMMNYQLPLDFYTQMIYTQFAAGVTKTVLHGYSSIAGSEEATYWPGHEGMWPMFSERFGSRQPAYRHYKDWTDMIARYQMMLRKGKPRMDLAILRLDYNYNNQVMSNTFIKGMNEEELYATQLMRNHEGLYWKDMRLQDAGYTWDYFAPQLLEEDFVRYGEGELLPQGPGYKALIVYQDVLPLSSAEKILRLAKDGLPVLFVDGCTETVRLGVDKTYVAAAEMTPYHDGNDERLAAVVKELKALPNVREVQEQSRTVDVLMEMGIRPRTAFEEPNQDVLTLSRKDGELVIVYAYNMTYARQKSVSFRLSVEGAGKPYRLNCCSGEIVEEGCYRKTKDATILELCLAPGEACLYVIDTSANGRHVVAKDVEEVIVENGSLYAKAFVSGEHAVTFDDGTTKQIAAVVPERVRLPLWELEVEDWNEGEKVEIFEDRGKGIVTKEVYYETKKERRAAGRVELKPWKDILQIGPEVSGVGYYRTTFTLPENWDDSMGARFEMELADKNTAAVYVNGKKAPGFDAGVPVTEITPLVRPGENEIVVEVSSTLNNRLLARGYFDNVMPTTIRYIQGANNAMAGSGDAEQENPMAMIQISSSVRDYGMIGEAKVVFYQKIEL